VRTNRARGAFFVASRAVSWEGICGTEQRPQLCARRRFPSTFHDLSTSIPSSRASNLTPRACRKAQAQVLSVRSTLFLALFSVRPASSHDFFSSSSSPPRSRFTFRSDVHRQCGADSLGSSPLILHLGKLPCEQTSENSVKTANNLSNNKHTDFLTKQTNHAQTCPPSQTRCGGRRG
jgi:hypothetical protein